jgi:hypothetical protein
MYLLVGLAIPLHLFAGLSAEIPLAPDLGFYGSSLLVPLASTVRATLWLVSWWTRWDFKLGSAAASS